ncbi:unnamed protein product [Durusdinium trenchii]|uniref:Uncharacterized protein n=1 Tax=Durusdinium trenchii TaxID=1381693 RepID=A0ABP0PSX8_9DINO
MESDKKSEISDRLHPTPPAQQQPNVRRPAPHVRPHDQDQKSGSAQDERRCRVEAMFNAKLRGSEVLDRQSYIELMKFLGFPLNEAHVLLEEN